jgi:hypothetical protein
MPHPRRTGSNGSTVFVFEVNFLTDKVFGGGCARGKEEHGGKGEDKKEEFFGHWQNIR